MLPKACILIPARLESTRLPNKLLREVCGKSVLQRTYEIAKEVCLSNETIVVVDGTDELYDHIRGVTKMVIRTSNNYISGSHRIAYAAAHRSLEKMDLFINVQADEVGIKPETIDDVIQFMMDNPSVEMATALVLRPAGHKISKNSTVRAIVKEGTIVDLHRVECEVAPFPFYEHVGVVGFTRKSLSLYQRDPISARALKNKNEYLTAIEAGIKFYYVLVDDDPISINTEEDLKRFEERVSKCQLNTP